MPDTIPPLTLAVEWETDAEINLLGGETEGGENSLDDLRCLNNLTIFQGASPVCNILTHYAFPCSDEETGPAFDRERLTLARKMVASEKLHDVAEALVAWVEDRAHPLIPNPRPHGADGMAQLTAIIEAARAALAWEMEAENADD